VSENTNSAEHFFHLPEVQCLLEIARSDNALIALDVQRREISWTQFMAWLLDPVRHGQDVAISRLAGLLSISLGKLPGATDDDIGKKHLDRLIDLRGRPIASVLEVKAEDSAKQAGRLDLMVLCEMATGQVIRLLIENKIDASEHDRQLSGYVGYHHPIAGEDVLLPVLVDVGDSPSDESTCSWAACLNRADMIAWLDGLAPLPHIAADYLAVFRAWEVASKLRVDQSVAIDAIRKEPDTIPEWPLIDAWLTEKETPFYLEALLVPELAHALEVHGYAEPETPGRMQSSSDMLKLTKPGWTMYPCRPDEKGVQIHLECDGRGKMRLDIEIYPYEGSITKKPDRLAALRRQLEFRAELHRQVRPRLAGLDYGAGMKLVTKSLRDPESPKANSAGRFDGGLDEGCTPGQHARFIAAVVEKITPEIDQACKLVQDNAVKPPT